jgi:hypothetical protein
MTSPTTDLRYRPNDPIPHGAGRLVTVGSGTLDTFGHSDQINDLRRVLPSAFHGWAGTLVARDRRCGMAIELRSGRIPIPSGTGRRAAERTYLVDRLPRACWVAMVGYQARYDSSDHHIETLHVEAGLRGG